jgi:NADH dehydrogenase
MKRIVIIGAGFGGLTAAEALRHAKAEIWVIDRANHNLFQPLLYQVATTVLSPAQPSFLEIGQGAVEGNVLCKIF